MIPQNKDSWLPGKGYDLGQSFQKPIAGKDRLGKLAAPEEINIPVLKVGIWELPQHPVQMGMSMF